MIASYDARRNRVLIEMEPAEFRETVEWLELVDPSDGATRDWRAAHDHLFPVRLMHLKGDVASGAAEACDCGIGRSHP